MQVDEGRERPFPRRLADHGDGPRGARDGDRYHLDRARRLGHLGAGDLVFAAGGCRAHDRNGCEYQTRISYQQHDEALRNRTGRTAAGILD